jgi:hypothetical protein
MPDGLLGQDGLLIALAAAVGILWRMHQQEVRRLEARADKWEAIALKGLEHADKAIDKLPDREPDG